MSQRRRTNVFALTGFAFPCDLSQGTDGVEVEVTGSNTGRQKHRGLPDTQRAKTDVVIILEQELF